MARYIDAEALLKKIFPYDVVDKKCYTINAKMIYEEIQKAPTAEVIVPPCKIGEPVYIAIKKTSRHCKAYAYVRKTKLKYSNLARVIADFGKTVFLTREEAEIAMTKGDNNVYQQKEI